MKSARWRPLDAAGPAMRRIIFGKCARNLAKHRIDLAANFRRFGLEWRGLRLPFFHTRVPSSPDRVGKPQEALMSKLMLAVALFAGATLYDPGRMLQLVRPGLVLVGKLGTGLNIDRYLPTLSQMARS
jgi:hypothetical protein